MPNLNAAALVVDTSRPFVWKCSDCDAIFSASRIGYEESELGRVDAAFRKHCEANHPGETIIGVTDEPLTGNTA
jgi:hypothetical protein